MFFGQERCRWISQIRKLQGTWCVTFLFFWITEFYLLANYYQIFPSLAPSYPDRAWMQNLNSNVTIDTYLNACISKSWISPSCNIWYKTILMSFNFVNFAKSENSWNISFSTRFKCKFFSSIFIVLLFSCNLYISQAYLQFIFFHSFSGGNPVSPASMLKTLSFPLLSWHPCWSYLTICIRVYFWVLYSISLVSMSLC